MTPKPLFRRAQHQHHVFPHLHLLRFIVASLLLLSVLPPRSFLLSTLLRSISPALPPFLIFLSGFNLTHSPRSLTHRLITLLPLHLFTVLIHLPDLRAFTDAFLLSPFLPLYALPSHAPPSPAPLLLPSLILLSLLHPAISSLLPRPSNPPHLLFVLALTWLSTVLQAIWLTHLPNTAANPRSVMLFDIAVYFPFLTHLPWFVAGILVAKLRHASTPSIHPVLPALLLLPPLRYFLSDIPATAQAWLATGALLPPFAYLVYCLTRVTLPRTSSLSYGRVSLTAFALAAPVHTLLAKLCNHTDHLCLPPIHFTPEQEPVTQLHDAAYRLLHPVTLPAPSVRATIYFPILILASVILHVALVHPVTTFLQTMAERTTPTSLPPPQFIPTPKRSMNRFERLIRVALYYIAGVGFISFVFRFSLPITRHLSARRLPSLLCYLPAAIYNCEPEPNHSMLAGALAKLGLGSEFLTAFADVFRWVSLLTLPTMLFNVVGHIAFPRAVWRELPTVPEMLNGSAKEKTWCKFVIYFRYVTRGNNARLVASNAQNAADVLSRSGLPKDMWRVEIVTDVSVDIEKTIAHEQVYEIVVPEEYVAANGALFKARALNYAIDASPARDEDWIVHLDEETKFDTDTVRGVLHHCSTEAYSTHVLKRQKWPRIGQGPILYGRGLMEGDICGGDKVAGNWLTTFADSGRVSDDCGRYRIQYECGEVWVGMHGSFVVACNCVERAVTFDHGVEGSIAEDAFFAMMARARNVRFRWIDAVMFEQSPFTVRDFVKQRARWLVGGLRVAWSGRIPLRLRLFMGVLTGLWALMPVMYWSLIVAVLFGSADSANGTNHVYYHVLLPLLASLSLWNYMFGFFATFSMRSMGVLRFVVALYAQLGLTPIFGVMEVWAVCYALWNFTKLSVGFHVVQKDGGSGDVKESSCDEEGVADEKTSLV